MSCVGSIYLQKLIMGTLCYIYFTDDDCYDVTGSCYNVVTTKYTYSGASAYCAALYPGAHLVELQTTGEQEFVAALVDDQCPNCKCYFLIRGPNMQMV